MSDRWPLWWRTWMWLHDIALQAHRWLRRQIVAEDPDPQYSELDREDGLTGLTPAASYKFRVAAVSNSDTHHCEPPGAPLPLPGDIWQCTNCERWWVGMQGRWLSTTRGELPHDLIIMSPYNTGLRFIARYDSSS